MQHVGTIAYHKQLPYAQEDSVYLVDNHNMIQVIEILKVPVKLPVRNLDSQPWMLDSIV